MIDVIIPTYNRAKAMELVIDSYLKQKHLGKIIIVDDCSTDTTLEYSQKLVQTYPDKIMYHRLESKSTLPDVRNRGINLAQNEFIFMGEDDVLLPENHFEILLEHLHNHNADIISGRRIYLWADQTPTQALEFANKNTGEMFTQTPFEAYLEFPVEKPMWVNRLHSNVLMKKSVAKHIAYDPCFDGNAFREETDFFLRAWDAGYKLLLIPDTLSFHMKDTPYNQKGGARQKRFVYEWYVWKNTARLFFKNRKIFQEKIHTGNIYLFFIRCMIARYTHGFMRRIAWNKHYE